MTSRVVTLDAVVTVTDSNARPVIWQIVSDGNDDASQGRLGASRPLAQAVLGRAVGERVEVHGVDGKQWSVTIEATTAPSNEAEVPRQARGASAF